MSELIDTSMRFKEWLQQEVGLNLAAPAPQTPNPTQVNKATDAVAKDTLAQFGPDLTKKIMSAPSQRAGIQTAASFAQKGLKKTAVNPAQSATNTAGVTGKIYSSITGQEPKTAT